VQYLDKLGVIMSIAQLCRLLKWQQNPWRSLFIFWLTPPYSFSLVRVHLRSCCSDRWFCVHANTNLLTLHVLEHTQHMSMAIAVLVTGELGAASKDSCEQHSLGNQHCVQARCEPLVAVIFWPILTPEPWTA
jgi:hypothetical protein